VNDVEMMEMVTHVRRKERRERVCVCVCEEREMENGKWREGSNEIEFLT
jgi:hypothetical protein